MLRQDMRQVTYTRSGCAALRSVLLPGRIGCRDGSVVGQATRRLARDGLQKRFFKLVRRQGGEDGGGARVVQHKRKDAYRPHPREEDILHRVVPLDGPDVFDLSKARVGTLFGVVVSTRRAGSALEAEPVD
eukprot:4219161-Prymnesium_polylepis.2